MDFYYLTANLFFSKEVSASEIQGFLFTLHTFSEEYKYCTVLTPLAILRARSLEATRPRPTSR
jgi:hypothetical protein